MSLKSFFQSIKNVFMPGSVPDDLKIDTTDSAEEHDIFFLARDAVDYEENLKDQKSWIKEEFENPGIKLNDPESMEPYIVLSLDVKTEKGDFRLVYYENNELVLRGGREVTREIEPEIGQRLDLDFDRV
ncbi:MAG: hypothetical protein ABEJ25_03350 [Candidatus Bipolaricaulia bacterium]